MSQIVCFIGVIGSGKDYAADKLVKKGFIKVKIADEIYNETANEFSINLSNYENKEHFKITPISIEGKIISGREFLDNKGKYRRTKNRDYWVNEWWQKIKPLIDKNKNVTCSDLRFLNELKFLYTKITA